VRGKAVGVGAPEPLAPKPGEPEPKRRASLSKDEPVAWKRLLKSMMSGEERPTKMTNGSR
jgi:hypothetical protein